MVGAIEPDLPMQDNPSAKQLKYRLRMLAV